MQNNKLSTRHTNNLKCNTTNKARGWDVSWKIDLNFDNCWDFGS